MHQLVLLDSEDMKKLNNGEEIELTIGAKCDGQFFNRTDLMTAYSIVLRKRQKELKTYMDIFKECKQQFNLTEDDISDWRPAHRMYTDIDDIVGGIIVWLKNGKSIIYKTDNLYKCVYY